MLEQATNQDHVQKHTASKANEKIQAEISGNIQRYSHQDAQTIQSRINELSREWDVERVLETNASILALSGLILGVFKKRKFLLIPGVVLGFLLQHALQGWCPPLPLIRRLGVRTRGEIDQEKCALQALLSSESKTKILKAAMP